MWGVGSRQLQATSKLRHPTNKSTSPQYGYLSGSTEVSHPDANQDHPPLSPTVTVAHQICAGHA